MNKKSVQRKWIGIILAVCLITLLPVGAVQAADFSHEGVVGSDEVIEDDVFLSSDRCTVDGVIDGNLVATCQTITINGTVTGDAFLFAQTIEMGESAVVNGNLFAFGQSVEMNGDVTGSMASAGETIFLPGNASVGRNLYFAGYEGKIEKGASIGMDLFGAARQILMSGSVARDLTMGGAAFELRGSIGRNAAIYQGNDQEADDVTVYSPWMTYIPESISSGIRFYEGASVGNDLTYSALENVDSQLQKYVKGTINFEQVTTTSQSSPSRFTDRMWMRDGFRQFRLTNAFSSLITIFALGAVAFWLLKKQVVVVKEKGMAFPGKAFGWGFVAILVGFMALLLIPITFILLGILVGMVSLGGLLFTWYGVLGLTIALAFALFILVVFTLSKIVAAYVFGAWLMKDVFKTKTQNRWIDLLVGSLFYVILCAIPYIGWLFSFAASLYGTGVLFIACTNVEKKK